VDTHEAALVLDSVGDVQQGGRLREGGRAALVVQTGQQPQRVLPLQGGATGAIVAGREVITEIARFYTSRA
jgi:hypothetical protein